MPTYKNRGNNRGNNSEKKQQEGGQRVKQGHAICWSRPFLTRKDVWPYPFFMATPKVKSTYSLDLDTTHRLDRLANAWKVSKSEALRQAILKASDGCQGSTEGLYALDRVQERLAMSAARAARFVRSVRSERAATSKRREQHR